MLSRLAEAMFWMERYRERAENTARIIDVNLNLNLDMPQEADRQWAPMVHTTGDWDAFEAKYDAPNEKNVLEFLTYDLENPNSILSCLAKARANAQSIRQIIPTDMWGELNTMYLYVNNTAQKRRAAKSSYEFYNRIKRHSNLFAGFFRMSMSHDEAWHFARLGSLLERADQMSRLVDIKYFILLPSVEYVDTPYDDILWSALLKSAGGFEMYRRRWGQILPARVLQFLVLDRTFPRSVEHCISEAHQALLEVQGDGRRLNDLKNRLARLQPEQIISDGVHEFMNTLQLTLSGITADITKAFFDVEITAPRAARLPAMSQSQE